MSEAEAQAVKEAKLLRLQVSWTKTKVQVSGALLDDRTVHLFIRGGY